MKSHFEELKVSTDSRFQLVNITSQVKNAVRNSGIENGICHVYAVHSTPAIIVTENERRLKKDLLGMAKELFRPEASWRHPRNAYAHIASAFLTTSKTFPIRDSRIVRGTWQDIFLFEFDGPRAERRILVQVIGE